MEGPCWATDAFKHAHMLVAYCNSQLACFLVHRQTGSRPPVLAWYPKLISSGRVFDYDHDGAQMGFPIAFMGFV